MPRDRLDAAFELASVLRCRRAVPRGRTSAGVARGRTRGGAGPRGTWPWRCAATVCAELGDVRAARRLIDRAIERSPGVPTRYLVTRGFLELRLGDLAAVRATASAVAANALPPTTPIAPRTRQRPTSRGWRCWRTGRRTCSGAAVAGGGVRGLRVRCLPTRPGKGISCRRAVARGDGRRASGCGVSRHGRSAPRPHARPRPCATGAGAGIGRDGPPRQVGRPGPRVPRLVARRRRWACRNSPRRGASPTAPVNGAGRGFSTIAAAG